MEYVNLQEVAGATRPILIPSKRRIICRTPCLRLHHATHRGMLWNTPKVSEIPSKDSSSQRVVRCRRQLVKSNLRILESPQEKKLHEQLMHDLVFICRGGDQWPCAQLNFEFQKYVGYFNIACSVLHR